MTQPEGTTEDQDAPLGEDPLALNPNDRVTPIVDVPAASRMDPSMMEPLAAEDSGSPDVASASSSALGRRSAGAVPVPNFAEYYSLTATMAAAQSLSDEVRAELAKKCQLVDQRGDSSEILWASGRRAEGLRLGAEALALANEALEFCALSVQPNAEVSSQQTHLDAVGMNSSSTKRIQRGREVMGSAPPLPELDSNLGSDWSRRFQLISDARSSIVRHLARFARSPRQVLFSKWLRRGVTLFALTLLVGFLGYRQFVVVNTTWTASGSHSERFLPEMAGDRDPLTKWLTPQNTEAWVQASFSRPIDIKKLSFLNTNNTPAYMDRATRDYRIDFFGGGAETPLHTIEGTFETIERAPQWREEAVNVSGVESIRFTVVSYHREGGGLAEFSWE